ncbi:MAG: response regulator [Zetaproteobacteria bacterium]|nr:response regulator [Zetaproteobacteria bacterium]
MSGKVKVLIVDDNEYMHKLVDLSLYKTDYHGLFAHSGKEALEIIEKEHPAIVLLDVMMPGLSGFDVCRTIKQSNHSATRVIFLTAMVQDVDRLRGFDVGGDAYTTKPFSPRSLVALIDEQYLLWLQSQAK